MEHTLPPPPPPDAPRPDTFYADLLRALARLVFYPLYRPFTHLPATWGRACATMGLRSLLMAGLVAILFKLVQHGLLLGALAHRSRLDPPIRPAGPWPLTAPLPTWQIVALVAGFALLLVLDRQNPRWPVHVTWEAPFVEIGPRAPVLVLPAVDPDLLVLGCSVTHIGNEHAAGRRGSGRAPAPFPLLGRRGDTDRRAGVSGSPTYPLPGGRLRGWPGPPARTQEVWRSIPNPPTPSGPFIPAPGLDSAPGGARYRERSSGKLPAA